MKHWFHKCEKSCGFSRIGLVLVLPFIVILVAYVAYKLFLVADPAVEGIDAFRLLPAEKTVTLTGMNMTRIEIDALQDGRKIELFRDTPQSGQITYTLQIRPQEFQLRDGTARIVIKAASGIFKDVGYEIDSIIDTVPPSLEIVRAPSLLEAGSTGLAVLRSDSAGQVYLRLGQLKFRGFRASSGSPSEPQAAAGPEADKRQGQPAETSYVFFPVPHDVKGDEVFQAVAEDAAGNETIRGLATRVKARAFRSSTINISDSFVERVVFPLLQSSSAADPVAAFRTVNEDWRNRDLNHLIDIAKKSESAILWEGRFLQLRNSKVMATYGDQRSYYYGGKPISTSVHLGYDLASYARAPVEAANKGVVVFAGDLGIYGNTVILDHGQGVMSLYGHLSSSTVRTGQLIYKGEVIGKTGSTGLAGGDHLHFSILIHGYEVSPLYWWDSRWIEANILDHVALPLPSR